LLKEGLWGIVQGTETAPAEENAALDYNVWRNA